MDEAPQKSVKGMDKHIDSPSNNSVSREHWEKSNILRDDSGENGQAYQDDE